MKKMVLHLFFLYHICTKCNNEQIEVIKNYTGTDEEIEMLAASAYVDLDIDYCEYSLTTRKTWGRSGTSEKVLINIKFLK